MAKKVNRKNVRKSKKAALPNFGIYWNVKNYLLLTLGIAVIIVGFVFMSMGSWNSFPSLFISPILLIIGYLFILPASILYVNKEASENKEDQEVASGKS
jgi:membrane protein YdbS with pleckstrin-like domain